jgi:pyruvate/oxaloacetate carboxyltransferase
MTHAGEYVLTDKSYARLLNQLAGHNFAQVTPELRLNILTFYGDPNAPVDTKKKAEAWQKTQEEVERLKAISPADTSAVQISTIP